MDFREAYKIVDIIELIKKHEIRLIERKFLRQRQ